MGKHICIIGIIVNERLENASKVQQVLTECGSMVLHRSGIPYSKCNQGIINVTLEATQTELDNTVKKLNRVEDITVNSMVLCGVEAKGCACPE